MIGYLKGHIKDINEETLLLEVQGVGYEILMPLPHLADLQVLSFNENHEVEIWIHTHVREDAFQLFGFTSQQEKKFFQTLLKINGVGPKMGLSILSGAHMSELIDMIEAEDLKALSKLPKVGKKTAEQMILALKGKIVKASPEGAEAKNQPRAHRNSHLSVEKSAILSALVNLGYRSQDVEKVVLELPQELSFQDGVRRSLQIISQGHQ